MGEKLVGTVSKYFAKPEVAAIKLTAPLKIGETVKFKGGEVEFEQALESMQVKHESVQEAKAGDEVGIKVKEKVRKGYKVFKV